VHNHIVGPIRKLTKDIKNLQVDKSRASTNRKNTTSSGVVSSLDMSRSRHSQYNKSTTTTLD